VRLNIPKLLLVILLTLEGICAIGGGMVLMLSPSGKLAGMDSNTLNPAGLKSFFIPGLILFLFLGIYPIVVAIGLTWKTKHNWAEILNLYPHEMHWSWTHSLYSGIITMIWINVQMLVVGYYWLQSVFDFWGLAILIFTLTPGIKKAFVIRKASLRAQDI
jgi:hypothetical protein